MNQVICLVGVGNWTVHKVENLPPLFSESRSEERRGKGEGGREKDGFIKTTEYLHALPWTCSKKIHQTPYIKV